MTRRHVLGMVMLAWSCPSASAQSLDPAPIFEHRLTIDLVQRSVAVDRDLLALIKKDPSITKKGRGTTPGIDATVKAIESIPELTRVLAAHGITARDYVLTQMALVSTTMIHELQEKGSMPPLPPGTPTHNIEFWKANYGMLKPLEDEWKKTRAAISEASARAPSADVTRGTL